MGTINDRLKNSLALRVLLSTIVLSSGVIWLSGSILESRVSAGVKQVNLDAAINEARSTIVGARYRLILAKSGSSNKSILRRWYYLMGILPKNNSANITDYKIRRGSLDCNESQ